MKILKIEKIHLKEDEIKLLKDIRTYQKEFNQIIVNKGKTTSNNIL